MGRSPPASFPSDKNLSAKLYYYYVEAERAKYRSIRGRQENSVYEQK